MQNKYPNFDLAFPEFLREGKALEDSLHPSRVICGSNSAKARLFLKLLKDSAKKKNIVTQVTTSSKLKQSNFFQTCISQQEYLFLMN